MDFLYIIIAFLIFVLLYIVFYLKNRSKNKNNDGRIKNKNGRIKNKNGRIKNNDGRIKNKDGRIKNKDGKTSIIKHIKKLQNEVKTNEVKLKTNEVYLTLEVNGEELGNILIRLFDKIVPKTCENFKQLCINKKYVDSPFHRIIKDFMIQGGDFTNHNGTGGESIYGRKFPDENFKLKHDKPYLVSMANSGPDTNGSQFFITTSETPHLDGKHVVFGEIVGGFDLVYYLNNTETDSKDCPINKIVIKDCGIN